MKFFKDWRFILLLTIILCLTPFFMDLYNQYTEQPSEGWSDAIELIQLTDADYFNQNIYSVLHKEDTILIGYYGHGELVLESFDMLGNKLDTWNKAIPEGKKLNKVLVSEKLIYLLIDDTLMISEYDENVIMELVEVDSGVLNFEYVDGILAYNTNTRFITSIGTEIENADGFDRYDILVKGDDVHIAYVALDGSERILNYIEHNNDETLVSTVGKLVINTVGDLEIYEEDGINIIVPNRVIPRNKEMYEIYTFKNPGGDVIESMKYFKTLKSFKISINVRPDGSHLMLIPEVLYMGQKYKAVNFWTTDHNGSHLKADSALTRTIDYSKYYDYFHDGENEYIVFADTKLAAKTIYLAGTTDELIAKGKSMTMSDYGAIFRDGTMSLLLLPTMIFMLYSFSAIASLAFYIISLMAMGDFYYNRPKLMRNVGTGIHVCVMMYYVYFMFINNNANPVIYNVMPAYLQSTGVIFGLMFLTMAASYFIVELFNKQRFESTGTIVSHFIFITLHTFLFAFVFYSHYAGFTILRYFLFN